MLPIGLTDDRGVRTKGAVVGVTPGSIILAPGGRFDAAAVRRVEVADSTADGALTGCAAGALGGILLALSPRVYGEASPSVVIGVPVAIGGVIGMLIDKSVTRTVYAAPSGSRHVQVGAVVTRAEKSLRVAIRF